MLDSVFGAFSGSPAVHPVWVVVRLLIAVLAGLLVVWVYRRTTRHAELGTFPTTLVLLCVLIAMVTQVIGDSVARAFSLVGALSIVRFRTVVRDTRDTAFVVFAVVMGMAIGAQNLWVATIGIVVTGAAAFLVGRIEAPRHGHYQPPLLLVVRVGFGLDPEQLLGSTFDAHLSERKLMSVSTAKQGSALQAIYETRLKPDASAVDLVNAMNSTEGVQEVRVTRRGFEAE
jgi:hypothetical protein